MKVAIVGAGISGLYLAWKLSEKGQEVVVFEKEKEIPKKACSGLVSERILDFIPESKKLIKNKINFVLIHFPKKTLKINFKKDFFIIDSFELKKILFNLAQKKGAKIFFDHPIYALPIGFNKIIGCDGADSKIRKILKLKNPDFYLGIQGFLKEKQNSNFVETWPTKYGFLWKIPRVEEIEYGIIEKTKRARKIFEEFLKKKNLERINSAIIPQGFSIPKNKKITLCGDASGLTKPWSGGGIIWGLMAAQILLKNFPDFLKYQKKMKKFFSLNISISKLAKRIVYFFGFNFPFVLPKRFKIDGDFLI
jgi:flavin-dependent dehydrogenase